MNERMESASSFMEVSYHSTDDIEQMVGDDMDEEVIYEEEEVVEEEEEDEDGQQNDVGNPSSPVRSKAPVPLHQLLANKLKNTNVKLTDNPSGGNVRSVKEMAAAFVPPRPSSARILQPGKTSPTKSPIQPSPLSPEQQSPKKFGGSKLSPRQLTKSPQNQFARRAPLKTGPSPRSSPLQRSKKNLSQGTISKTPKFTSIPIKRRPTTTTGKPITRMNAKAKNSSLQMMSRIKQKQQPKPEISSDESTSDYGSSVSSDSKMPVSSAASSYQEDDDQNNRQSDSTSGTSSSESSSSSSSSSFSVSSGTDASLAAKIGDLGAPFAPLPIAANFIPDDLNPDVSNSSSSTPERSDSGEPDTTSSHGSFELGRPVSWSDLLGKRGKDENRSSIVSDSEGGGKGDGNEEYDDTDENGGGDDGDVEGYEDSYESYETASSDEFETDSEETRNKSAGPPGINLDELVEDEESAETSDYETDTTYERKYAESEGRTPPPPKKPSSDPRLNSLPVFSLPQNPNLNHMPVVNENELQEEWSESSNADDVQRRRRQLQNRYRAPDAPAGGGGYEMRGRRRKPFEDIPTAVAAELRNISKNPSLGEDDGAPLGIMGWDGQERSKGGNRNLLNQIFKKKGDVGVEENKTDSDTFPPVPVPPSPRPFDPPDYDDDEDEISNITDRVFFPKPPKPEQYPDPMTQRSLDSSGRFSITSFRKSNSVRNTERALEGLKSTSIEPRMSSKKGKRGLAPLPEERRRSPALLNMQNEAVDYYIPHEYNSTAQSYSDYHGMSPSSSRAFDSRDVHDVETQGTEGEPEEIIEEIFVGYDDEDAAEFNEERLGQDRPLNPEHDGVKNHVIENFDEKNMNRNSKRFYIITCTVICNLLLLLGIGSWLLVEYFLLDESRVPSTDSSQGVPALPPMKPRHTFDDIKGELITILKPNLADGGKSFDEKTSPQSEAVHWLSKDPKIHTYDENKIFTRFALATFYYATDGENWTSNHLWLTDLDECLWYTSSLDNPCTEGRYVRLVLTDNNLQGTIPEDLSLLSNNLVNLELVGTFSGEIPSTVGNLGKLTSLRLSGRSLSGQIPDSLYTLSNLSIMDLRQNLLSGGLSSSIGNLSSSLSSISLMDNHLTGPVPKEIGQLSGLTHFNIDDNYFNDLSDDIGQLTKLETLSARNNALKGNLPSTIGKSLTNLKGLFLNNNQFTGSIPDSFGNLSKLETGLDLSSNRLIGRVPESLGQLSMLRNLLIRDNELSGTIPSSWGKLSILNTLRLDSTNFEGEMPTELCDNFNEAYSSFYVDCWKLDCPCCNFCCDGDTGECICRFEDSLPILCVEP